MKKNEKKGFFQELLNDSFKSLNLLFAGVGFRSIVAWQILMALPLHLLSVLVGYFLLLRISQGREFFLSMREFSLPHTFFFLLSLFVWAITLWHSARVILNLLNLKALIELDLYPEQMERAHEKRGQGNGNWTRLIDYFFNFGLLQSRQDENEKQEELERREKFALKMKKWAPRLLGLLPFLIAFAGWFLTAATTWVWLATLAAAVMYLLIVIYRRFIIKGLKLVRPSAPDSDSVYSLQPIRLRDYDIKAKAFIFVYYGAAAVYVTVICCFPAASSLLGSAAVAVSALTLVTAVSTIFGYVQINRGYPVFILFILAVLLFSNYNNNHTVSHLDTRPEQRLKLDEYAERWYDARSGSAYGIDTSAWEPVYLVAVEGGGIRGVSYTGMMLKLLEDSVPHFRERTFSVSGASGGMVGALFYQSWKYTHDTKPAAPRQPAGDAALRDFLSDDYLSYVLSAFAFPEALQRMLPLPIKSCDRGLWFERSIEENFADAIRDVSGPGPAEKCIRYPFLQMWPAGDPVRYPAFFINGMAVETGHRATYSNIVLEQSIFPNTLDIHQLLGGDVKISTASTFCCRFPYILPAATLVDYTGKKRANIVDGGYLENTGIQLNLEMIAHLKSAFRDKKLYPVIVFIQNNEPLSLLRDDVATPTSEQYSDYIIDLVAPAKGLVNQRESSTATWITYARMLEKKDSAQFRFLHFALDHQSTIALPLGWSMSEIARKEIERQVDNVARKPNQTRAVECHNHQTFRDLLRMDAGGK